MDLTEKDAMFQAADGQHVLRTGNGHRGQIYLSHDGITFYEVHETGARYSTIPPGKLVEENVSFHDPHRNRDGELYRKDDLLKMDGKVYSKIACPGSINAVPLPDVRKPEYFFKLPDGRLIYVSADEYRYSYASFRIFIGAAESMKPIATKWVERLRDGGTTYITTAEGKLYSAPRGSRGSWTPAGQQKAITLTPLNPAEFEIVETANGVTVTRKG